MPLLRPVPPEKLPVGDNMLQSPFWAVFKSRFGWQPHAFLFGEAPLLLLERKLPGGYSLLYAPHPFDPDREALSGAWGGFCDALKTLFPRKRICVRFDLPWDIDGKPAGTMLDTWGLNGLVKASMDIQPPSTVIVPLEGTEEEQLAAMKGKTRYNIRLAFRKGVETRLEGPEFIGAWYELYRETAARDRISIHSPDYYRQLFLTAERMDTGAPDLRIITASHEGDLLASIIVGLYGSRATYLYGASSNNKRNLMASYAAQWTALKLARDEGCGTYDLFGIPPADDPGHPMHGLYRFKTGFGGKVLHRPGAWDLPLSGTVYPLYRRAEYLRNYYFKKLKKR